MTLAVNGQRATKLRVLTPWSGVWEVEAELPVDPGGVTPTGSAVATVETSSLVGTIDGDRSGVFAAKGRLRIVGGGGGWEQVVPPKGYRNDGGLLSTAVLATTAAEVGERLVELLPFMMEKSYARAAGPASRVLAGLSWHVDHAGITRVGERIPTPAPPDVTLLDYDAHEGVADLATTTTLVTPGMIVTDPRVGTLKIRDVEQTFGDGGARAKAWCLPVTAVPAPDGLPGGRLIATMSAIAREAVGAVYLQDHRYRVVAQGPDGRVTLQAVERGAPVPSLKLTELAPGVPGTTMKLAPGSIVRVRFAEGEPTRAAVVGFESGPAPLEINFDALITKAGGTEPLALAAAVVEAFGVVAANAGLTSATMTTALGPVLLTIPTKRLLGG